MTLKLEKDASQIRNWISYCVTSHSYQLDHLITIMLRLKWIVCIQFAHLELISIVVLFSFILKFSFEYIAQCVSLLVYWASLLGQSDQDILVIIDFAIWFLAINNRKILPLISINSKILCRKCTAAVAIQSDLEIPIFNCFNSKIYKVFLFFCSQKPWLLNVLFSIWNPKIGILSNNCIDLVE